jgi:hypothetical protein
MKIYWQKWKQKPYCTNFRNIKGTGLKFLTEYKESLLYHSQHGTGNWESHLKGRTGPERVSRSRISLTARGDDVCMTGAQQTCSCTSRDEWEIMVDVWKIFVFIREFCALVLNGIFTQQITFCTHRLSTQYMYNGHHLICPMSRDCH